MFYAGSSYWVTHSMHNYGGIPLWLCFIILIIFSATLGVFTGLFGAMLALAVKRFGGWAMLAAPVIWAASEWAAASGERSGLERARLLAGVSTGGDSGSPMGGVYLVSAIMVAASTALVFGVVYLEQRRGIVVLTVAGAIAIATVLYGESLRPSSDESGSISVAAIQPNIPIDGAWDDPQFVDGMRSQLISSSERMIQEARAEASSSSNGVSANGDANGANTRASKPASIGLVIWPESPMTFEYDRDEELRLQLGEFTRRNNVYLLINSWGFADPENSGVSPAGSQSALQYNSAVLISPSGEKADEYDKNALVPFGEFVPARGWIPFMDRIPALVADIAPGKELKVIDAAGARLGMSICFEVTRPDLARRMRLQGATALVQISNELWFGASSMPRQMLAEAVFRAVENGVDLVRVTNSGLSARISSYGIVTGETPLPVVQAALALAEFGFQQAGGYARRVARLAERAGDGILHSIALDQLTLACFVDDDIAEAVRVARRRLDVLDTLAVGPLGGFELADGELMAAEVDLAAGNLAAAAGHARALAGLPFYRDEDHVAMSRRLLVDALAGHFDDVVRAGERFRAGWERAGRPVAPNLARSSYAVAMVHGMRGDDERRAAWVRMTVDLGVDPEGRAGVDRGWPPVFDGLLALDRDDPAAARRILAADVDDPELFRSMGSQPWRPWYAALWAEAAALDHHPDAAARIVRSRRAARDNPIAAAMVERAGAIATGDRDALVRLAITFAQLGCPYQQARTGRIAAGMRE